MTDRDLPIEHLCRDVRDVLAEQIARELRDVSPDFVAVIEAAHARDPQRVPRAALDEALALAPIVPLGSESSQRMSVRASAELGALLADVRGEVDDELAALRRRGLPPVPVPKASQVVALAPRRRWLWGAAAAAAAAILALATPMLATRFAAEQGAPTQAPWWEHDRSDPGTVTPAEPEPVREAAPRRAPEPAVTPEPEPEPMGPALPEDIVPAPQTEPADEPVSKARKAPRGATLAEQLRTLDAEAEAAWHSGDYAGAERRFREIVALAPGSRAADLSYGDLFTLARQRSGPDQERALWREYLAAFPRGRWADDARAGLCRRAEHGERPACWQQYLADFPAGVHRSQAARALDDPAP